MSAAGTTNHLRYKLKAAAPARPADLVVLVCLAALLVAAAAGLWLGIRTIGADPSTWNETVTIRIGSTPVTVPRAWLRSSPGAIVQSLELAVPLAAADLRGSETGGPLDNVLLLQIRPADEALDPAERPADLYARFLTGEVWTNPGGLLLRRFQAGSPYDGEELYLAPPEGRAFAARCPRSDARISIPGHCIWELRQNGLDVLVAFPHHRLTVWEDIASTARETVSSLIVR